MCIRDRNKATVFPKPTQGAKESILNYQILKTLDNFQLLEVDLETGRHHQIRAQLSKIGVPIKGDLKYGSAPVSYTHLDVYKRQGLERAEPYFKSPFIGTPIFESCARI